MSWSPLDTTFNYRTQAKEKCTTNAQQLGCLPDISHSLSTAAEVISTSTASQICMFPWAGSNVWGSLRMCFITPLPSFHWTLPNRSKTVHNLQPPIQACLPKSFLGLDYDHLWQILSVNNTANRKEKKRSDYTHWLKIYQLFKSKGES